MKKLKNTCLAFLACMLSPIATNADLISVQWTDNNGPQWTGVVDTIADSLVIQTWIGSRWTPSVLPITFQAYSTPFVVTTFAALNAFDVPDNWDGTIGGNWGFLSDLTKDAISWNEGVFTGNSSRLGWGISQFNDGSIRTDFWNTAADFSFVPFSSTGNNIRIADSVIVTSVPEPSTLTLLGMGLLGIGIGLARRRRKV